MRLALRPERRSAPTGMAFDTTRDATDGEPLRHEARRGLLILTAGPVSNF